jgi:hypothetical protein
VRTRAAASSIASGSPSRRAQIPPTASVLASVQREAGPRGPRPVGEQRDRLAVQPSGGTAYSFSP